MRKRDIVTVVPRRGDAVRGEDFAAAALADQTRDGGSIDGDGGGVTDGDITTDGACDGDVGGKTFCNVHHVVGGDTIDGDGCSWCNGVDGEEMTGVNGGAVAGVIGGDATDGDGTSAFRRLSLHGYFKRG